jgi:hypothetical protein
MGGVWIRQVKQMVSFYQSKTYASVEMEYDTAGGKGHLAALKGYQR